MFNNLIESSSHRQELKRRGSFFLVTTATYGLMLVLTGVASIYAYDARLDEQVYEQVITMLPPEETPAAPAPTHTDRPRNTENSRSNIPERAIAMLDTNRPDVVPPEISAKPNKVLPLPPGLVRITGQDWNPPVASGGDGTGRSLGGSRTNTPPRVILDDDLPALPPQPPRERIIKISKVLNSQAVSLPKPIYPPLAKQIGQQGTVTIQVVIDEKGRVISAQPIGGPPLLIAEAKRAALQAKFSPTIIGEQPVKVSGVITYNFVLQ